MNQTERIYKIDQLLHERKIVPKKVFLSALEVSPASLKRDLLHMRDRLNAPIIWDREAGGYRFDKQGIGDKYTLPGLWFNSSEIHALLTMRQLLNSLGPGLLTAHIEPLLARLRLLLDGENVSIEAFEKRIRIQRLNARVYEPEHFMPVATAVIQRKRLLIEHYNKARNETTVREISPQRLTHYRENWYVDAWCHLRNEIRSFGLSALRQVSMGAEPAKDIADAELCGVLDSGYGIFAGPTLEWAELVFSGKQARWVSQETWHPEQQSTMDENGNYRLRFPYSDPTEISMDILRHVPEVRIVSPASLRERVMTLLSEGLKTI